MVYQGPYSSYHSQVGRSRILESHHCAIPKNGHHSLDVDVGPDDNIILSTVDCRAWESPLSSIVLKVSIMLDLFES
jgi:hypothetical protein